MVDDDQASAGLERFEYCCVEGAHVDPSHERIVHVMVILGDPEEVDLLEERAGPRYGSAYELYCGLARGEAGDLVAAFRDAFDGGQVFGMTG
jgi:hypothetical protein